MSRTINEAECKSKVHTCCCVANDFQLGEKTLLELESAHHVNLVDIIMENAIMNELLQKSLFLQQMLKRRPVKLQLVSQAPSEVVGLHISTKDRRYALTDHLKPKWRGRHHKRQRD